MRKCIIIYSLLWALTVMSCRKLPVHQEIQESIEFVSPMVQTKSMLITDKTQMKSGENELAYGVFAARYLPDGQGNITSHDADFMTNLKVYSDLTGAEWHYDGDRYFWSPGAAYKFFAVYPYYNASGDDTYDLGISYSINTSEHALQVTGKHVVQSGTDEELIICTGTNASGENYLCPDILYGVSKYSEPYQVGEVRGPVNFRMEHAFSALSFRFRNASEYAISSIYTYTDVDNPSGSSKINMQVTGFDNVADHVFLSEDGAVWSEPYYMPDHSFLVPQVNTMISSGAYYPGENDFWYTALIIPQDFADYPVSPSFTFFVDMGTAGEKKYKINFKDYPVHAEADKAYKFLPGKRYVYNFNVTASKVLCDVTIVPWIEDDPIQLN